MREQLLLRGGGEYVGNKKSPTTFVTCHGGEIDIKDGIIKPTTDKCTEPIVSPITGTVKKATDGTLTITDSHDSIKITGVGTARVLTKS